MAAKDITQYTVSRSMEPGKMWFVCTVRTVRMNKQGLSATLLEASQDKFDAAGISHQASGSTVILLWLKVMKICAIFFSLP